MTCDITCAEDGTATDPGMGARPQQVSAQKHLCLSRPAPSWPQPQPQPQPHAQAHVTLAASQAWQEEIQGR